jgi:cbb3-type cytochrome oxidase subunit 3
MTDVDVFGAALSVVIFILMTLAYYYAFSNKNKKQFEDMSNFVNEEDSKEEKNKKKHLEK